MTLKGGRIASQSPLHNSAAPGIVAGNHPGHCCAHCFKYVEKCFVHAATKNKDLPKNKIFCINCWNIIAGKEFIPKNAKDFYSCAVCNEGISAGTEYIMITTKHVINHLQLPIAYMGFHDECFSEAAGPEFWN